MERYRGPDDPERKRRRPPSAPDTAKKPFLDKKGLDRFGDIVRKRLEDQGDSKTDPENIPGNIDNKED